MKNFSLLLILAFLTVFPAFGQKRKTPVKPARAKQTAAPVEISVKEWNAITDALDKEDWTQAATLSSLALNKLKTDNGKKQLARLRYFYLYALAGKVIAAKMTYAELEKTVSSFIGKDFLMPARAISTDCTKMLNYICASKDDAQVLRVTATNKAGTAIHSFEYVETAENFDTAQNSGKSAFLGGTLQKAEFNERKSNIWIMRLYFRNGFVNIVSGQ